MAPTSKLRLPRVRVWPASTAMSFTDNALKPLAWAAKEYVPAGMILNTQDPAESDLTIKTAPVLWLVRAHSAPGTAAPELSRTATRNELETFCASAILTAQARITTNNILNFFIETPVSAGNPKPAVWSPDEDPSHSQDFEPR